MLEKNEMCSELTSETAENGYARAGKKVRCFSETQGQSERVQRFGFGEGLYYSVKWGGCYFGGFC